MRSGTLVCNVQLRCWLRGISQDELCCDGAALVKDRKFELTELCERFLGQRVRVALLPWLCHDLPI
jgi:hypothetical protein